MLISTGRKSTITFYKKPPNNHPIYQLIGRVAAEWADLEHQLDGIINGMVDGTALVDCVTAQMMGTTPRFNAIIAILTMLARSHPGFASHIKKVNSLLHRSYEVADKRNRIIHDPWHIEEKTKRTAQWRTMPRKELRWGMKNVSRRYVNTAITETRHLSAQVLDLRHALLDELGAWRQRQHEAHAATHPSSALPGAQ